MFFFPAAGYAEKDGCFTNTQRLLQWHEKAVEPPGDCRSDGWFVYHLGRRLKAMAARDERPENAGLRALTWEYEEKQSGLRGDGSGLRQQDPSPPALLEPDVDAILHEINGFRTADRTQVSGFTELAADGSTACGCWIYSGVYPAAGMNRARSRQARRTVRPRLGLRVAGRPAHPATTARRRGPTVGHGASEKKLVWWDAETNEWTGLDEPDFPKTKAPSYIAVDGRRSGDGLRGDAPFIMHPDGQGWLWVESGLKDGPLPTHYEPLESPLQNVVYAQQTNPAANRLSRPDNT